MRVLAVITRRPQAASRLDAEIRVGETGPGETVLLRMYGALGEHADSVVTPLLMPDTPVVTWWPGIPPGRPVRQTRWARWPSAGSPTPRRPPSRTDCLTSLAAQLPARGHRPELDPGHPVADAARRHPGPAARHDQRRAGGRRGGQPERRPDRVLAVRPARRAVRGHRCLGGPGITAVSFDTSDGEIAMTRPDGRVAMLRRPGQPERQVALHRRDTAELLAEELRRLDPDEVYGETHRAVPQRGPRRGQRQQPGRQRQQPVSTPEVLVHHDAEPAGQGGRRPAGHQAGGRPGAAGASRRWC